MAATAIKPIFPVYAHVMFHSVKGFLAPAASYLVPDAGGFDCTVCPTC